MNAPAHPRLADLACGAAAAFRSRTGAAPEVLWAAPGRVNLIGEHTDYADGFVLPVAIDRWTVVAASARHDGLLRCWSTRSSHPMDGAAGAIHVKSASRDKTVKLADVRPRDQGDQGGQGGQGGQGDRAAPTGDAATTGRATPTSSAAEGDRAAPGGRLAQTGGAASGDREAPAGRAAPLDGLSGGVAYLAGAAWALARHGVHVAGADLVVHGDLPVGAGLASSAALTCAAGGALAQLAGASLPPVTLARLARQAEVEIVGLPCGVMDQLACTLGRAGHALFLDTRTLEPALIPLDLEASGLRLLVIDTRAEHKLVEDAYAQRHDDVQEAARRLGVTALRDATPAAVQAAAGALGPRLTRRARHVTTENTRVLEALELLRGHAPGRLGPLLAASHTSLRDDFEVSCQELDVAVAAAVGAGAAGARMTGAGFGGSALALVPTDRVAAVSEGVRAAFTAEGLRAPDILEVQPTGAAGPVA